MEMDYKIWKYKKGGFIKGLFEFSNIGLQFCIVIAAVLVMVGAPFLMGKLHIKMTAVFFMALTIGIVAVIMICLILMCLKPGQGFCMQLSFARDGNGSLYVFDYRSTAMQNYAESCRIAQRKVLVGRGSTILIYNLINVRNMVKLINMIDENGMLEDLLEQKRMLTYGKRIVSIMQIEEKRRTCNIFCILADREGREYERALVLPKNYKDYKELMDECRKLQKSSGDNEFKY